MAETNSAGPPAVSDEQLLASAIPLSQADLDGDDAVESDAPPQAAAPSPSPATESAERNHGSGKPSRDARYVKTFVTKLKQDLNDPLHGAPHCIEEIDKQINAWLKAHPGVTVKFATMVTGEMMSKKGADSALIMSVWVGRSGDG